MLVFLFIFWIGFLFILYCIIYLVCNVIRDIILSFLGFVLRIYLDFGVIFGYFGDEVYYEFGGYCFFCFIFFIEIRDLEILNNNKLR